MTNPANGSAHHHPSAALSVKPTSTAAARHASTEGDATLGEQDRVTECFAGDRFPAGQNEHHDAGRRGPDDAERRVARMVATNERVRGLGRDVDGEREERTADQPQPDALSVPVRAGEFPHDDEGGTDLDCRVEPETGGCRRTGSDRCDHEDRNSDDVPAEGRIFETKSSTCERVVHSLRMP